MPEGEEEEETGKRSLRGRTKLASVGSRSTASGSAEPLDSSLARSNGVLHSLLVALVHSLSPGSAPTRLQSSLALVLTGSSISRSRRCFCCSLKFIFASCCTNDDGGGLEIRKVLKSPAVTWLFLFLPGTDEVEDRRVRFRSPLCTTGIGSFSSCTFSCLPRREEEEEREERRAKEEEMWQSSWEE